MNKRQFLGVGGILSLEVLLGCSRAKNIIMPECPQPEREIIEIVNEKEVEVIVNKCLAEKKSPYAEEEQVIKNEHKALLDTIAWAEGTGCYYNMMFGRQLFYDLSAHPVETGEMPKKGFPFGPRWRRNTSTAAGRYQFLYKTYKALKEEGLFQENFGPDEQDKAAVHLITVTRDVSFDMLVEAVQNENLIPVWDKLAKEWASLPYSQRDCPRRRRCGNGRSYYGQFAYKAEVLTNNFLYFYKLLQEKGVNG